MYSTRASASAACSSVRASAARAQSAASSGAADSRRSAASASMRPANVTAAQHGFERGGRIEDSIDGAGLKSLIGLATFGDIHSGDLLDQTGEIAASQLTMDDGPYHASLPLRIRERQAWCRSSIWLFGNALR